MSVLDLLSFVTFFAVSFALGGCEPHVAEFEYLPHPAIVEIRPSATQSALDAKQPLVVYATVIGVLRAQASAHLPVSVQIRLRFDSTGQQNIQFEPHSFGLVTGDLFRFAPPIVQPPQTVTLGMGQSAVLDVYFPFPPGTSYDHLSMGTLLLRWQVRIDGKPIQQHARFRRMNPDYVYDPREDFGFPYSLGYPFRGSAEVQYSE